MTGSPGAPVAIGFGNPLRGDDGVGLRVIDGLRELGAREPGSLPPGTCLYAAGSPSLDLLAIVRDAQALLLVDGLDDGREPGSVDVVVGDRVAEAVGRGAISQLLAAARLVGCLPDEIALVGVQVAATDVGIGLSTAIEDAVPAAVSRSRRELLRLAALPRATRHRTMPTTPSAERATQSAGGVSA